jgi:uncharacterized protein YcbK (DUF882 family)
MWRVWAAALVVAAGSGVGRAEPRFFVAGTGTLAVESVHTGDRAAVTYRRPDGTYDDAAFARLRHVLRSRGDDTEGPLTPRFVELLGYLYDVTGRAPLEILSGYRSPDYNAAIRAHGARAASASLHTEGMAADVAFPKKDLRDLWLRIRRLECCGAGYYADNGFLHVDVGQPRFWEPATSGVERNLSAGNARLFARTDFDRYAAGDRMIVRLHALTMPPVRLRTALEPAGRIVAPEAGPDGCVEADAATRLVVADVSPTDRQPLAFVPCEPRPGRTPTQVLTNPVTVRAAAAAAVSP